MTKKALAGSVGISPLTLTRIENGETKDPEHATVCSLAASLRYPVSFFYGDDIEELSTEAVSFRSLSSMSAKERDAALAAGALACYFDDWISQRFNLPEPMLPDLRHENPISAASRLRSTWQLGSRPIPNLLKLLEAKGVRVFTLAEHNKNVDAFSCWRGQTPLVFLNTYKSPERSRFDTAHELGHLVMHMHGGGKGRDREREADQFASAFLIPRDDLLANIPRTPTVNQLIKAKARWGVSVAALARSIYDAGAISEWHYRGLCKKISKYGYRVNEPESRSRERSVVWGKVMRQLWKEKITTEKISHELGVPVDEIDSMLGQLATPQGPFSYTDQEARVFEV